MTRTTDPEQMRLLARLRHLGRSGYPGLPAGSMLLLYAQPGLLARLDASASSEQFVLKGALSLFARYDQAARPTEDLDLAARGLPNTSEEIGWSCARSQPLLMAMDSCSTRRCGSPLSTRPSSTRGSAHGARLVSSRAVLQIDVSFGNAITPAPVVWTVPPLLLDHSVPVSLYSLETVLAEKFAALVEIGEDTTRMKDLYDLHVILSKESFSAVTVTQAGAPPELRGQGNAAGGGPSGVGTTIRAVRHPDAALAAVPEPHAVLRTTIRRCDGPTPFFL